VRIGQRFLLPYPKVDIPVGIPGDHCQVGLGQRMAIASAQHANGDWLVVNHREGLIRATDLSGEKNQSSAKRPCQKSDHGLRPGLFIGAVQKFLSLQTVFVFSVLSATGESNGAEEPHGEKNYGADQFQRTANRDANQPKRHQQQPDDRIQQERSKGQRPAQHQQNAPQEKLHHSYSASARTGLRPQWFIG
jgi:hypothetical protein